MGLNESFGHIRSSILARKPVVTVNEAYAVAAQEESQRALGVLDRNKDPLTFLAGRTQGSRPKPKKFVPPGTICDHCGFKGHFKGDCYRLVGYPPDFQSKRRGPDGFKPDFKPNAHLSRNTDDLTNKGKLTENQMSSSQYEELANKMDRSGMSDCVANTSGMDSFDFTTYKVYKWIIDSGATHHITPNEELLIANRGTHNSAGVQVPTGKRFDSKSIGVVKILEGAKLKNVLHVPNFKFSLLSIAKITRELSCSVSFYPDYYIFQGLYNGKVLGIGKQKVVLYILKNQLMPIVHAVTVDSGNKDTKLWNLRLGHVST